MVSDQGKEPSSEAPSKVDVVEDSNEEESMVAMNREFVIETVHGVRHKVSADWTRKLWGRLDSRDAQNADANEKEPSEEMQAKRS